MTQYLPPRNPNGRGADNSSSSWLLSSAVDSCGMGKGRTTEAATADLLRGLLEKVRTGELAARSPKERALARRLEGALAALEISVKADQPNARQSARKVGRQQ